MNQFTDRRVLTTAQAASLLAVSPKSLADARWRRRVGLRATRVGRSLRFLESELERLLARGLEQLPKRDANEP